MKTLQSHSDNTVADCNVRCWRTFYGLDVNMTGPSEDVDLGVVNMCIRVSHQAFDV